jgi:hypothetical protein
MNDSPNNQSFISGIYNFCDRWCERCRFTTRCRVFADLQESPHDADDMESVVGAVRSSLADAKQMLIEKAEEFGIDPFALSDEEFAEIRRREKAFVEGHELSHLAEQYLRSAMKILEDDTLRDDDSLSEHLAVLGWFLFFIPVKIKSGLNGLLDDDGFEDDTQTSVPQSYANGTVKVALIAIERSLIAWRQLADAGHKERVAPVIDLLESIQVNLEKRFPLARDFIRPGFEEIEMVM